MAEVTIVLSRIMRRLAGGVLLAAAVVGAPQAASAQFCYWRVPALADMTVEARRVAGAEAKLVGGIYDVREKQLRLDPDPCDRLPWEWLAGSARPHAADVLLLGEVHDNPWHHRIRAEIVRQAATRARPPALVFEHIRADQQPKIADLREFDAQTPRLGTAGDLFKRLEWEKSGWPDQKLFAPLFEAALATRLPILAGDPPRETVRTVAKDGEGVLPEPERKRLALDVPLPASAQDALLGDLEASHCGLMPKSAFGKLAVAQRYRDAHLADVVLQGVAARGSVVLLAGNGHVRADRGVPWYVRQRAPGRSILSVVLVEVEDGRGDPDSYLPKDAEGQPAADFVVFTPRIDRPDPCEEMRKHFKR